MDKALVPNRRPAISLVALLEVATPGRGEAEVVYRAIADETDNVNEVTVLRELRDRYVQRAGLSSDAYLDFGSRSDGRTHLLKIPLQQARTVQRWAWMLSGRSQQRVSGLPPMQQQAPNFDFLRTLTAWVPFPEARKAQKLLLADEAAEILELLLERRIWCARWRTAWVAIHWCRYLLGEPFAALIRLLFHAART